MRFDIGKHIRRWRAKQATTPPLYFLHIPKTAGTSVVAWLSGQLGDSAVCPARIWDHLVKLDGNTLSEYRAFAGHFGVDLGEFLELKLVSASVFRDPVARTLSHYRHVFRDPGHPRHAHVARQSFGEFVEDADNWAMIENFQARYLVQTPLSFQGLPARIDHAPWKYGRLSVLSEDSRYLLDTTYVRERSIEALGELDVVGTTDDLARFFTDVAAAVHIDTAGDAMIVPRENAAPVPDREPLTEQVLDTVRRLTTLDGELFQMARSKALTRS